MNRRGFEFSVGIIVLLIFSILIFSMSVYLLFKWFGNVDTLSAQIDKQTQEEILSSLNQGNKLVSIPFPVQVVKRGKAALFGVGIRNPTSSREFSMQVSYSGAFSPDGRTLSVDRDYIAANWLGSFAVAEPFLVQKNEQKAVPVLIKADVNSAQGVATQKGDYVFNVCVYDQQATMPCTIESYRSNVAAFYSGKIYQVTVRVD